MLKLYMLKLRIIVLLLKSIVNSHATMIMTIGNVKDYLTLSNEKLISKV